MSVETQAANLATAVNGLVSAVNTAKGTLDTNVASAQTAHSATVAAYEGARTAADDAKADVDAVYEALRSAGSLASYQDLAAVTSAFNETAYDVLVYDTKQDSDGGAWRHKSNHTTWYNEELGTTTRGTRREFPSVVLVVSEATSLGNTNGRLWIFDADDPSLPMWRIFNNGTLMWDFYSTTLPPNTSAKVAALDGKICFVNNSNAGWSGNGLYVADFAADQILAYAHSGGGLIEGIINGRVRPYTGGLTALSARSSPNCVAITALPNAPRHSITGLPIPTIAVGGESHCSVLRDDNTAVNLASAVACSEVEFLPDGRLMVVRDSTMSNGQKYVSVYDAPYDGAIAESYTAFANQSLGDVLLSHSGAQGTNVKLAPMTEEAFGWGHSNSSGMVKRDRTSLSNGLVNMWGTTYCTGWMPGDTVFAGFCDSIAHPWTNGQQIVTGDDSEFTSSAGNWAGTYGGTIASVSGELEVTSSTSVHSRATVAVSNLVPGVRYKATIEGRSGSGGKSAQFQLTSSGGSSSWGRMIHNGTSYFTTNSTMTLLYFEFIATSATEYFSAGFQGDGAQGDTNYFDNFQVSAMVVDHSYAANHATWTAPGRPEPVATGAEMNVWDGFAHARYLDIPYDSSFDFGTGDFTFAFWYSMVSTPLAVVYSRGDGTQSTTNDLFRIALTSVGGWQIHAYDSSGNIQQSFHANVFNALTPDLDTFYHQVITRSGSDIHLYTNGIHRQTISNVTFSIGGSTQPITRIGHVAGNLNVTNSWGAGSGHLSMFRASRSSVSAEQVRFMYDSEKHLFKQNAACTLVDGRECLRSAEFPAQAHTTLKLKLGKTLSFYPTPKNELPQVI